MEKQPPLEKPPKLDQAVLPGWRRQALRHWEEFRPRTTRALRADGSLDQLLDEAVQNTYDQMRSLLQSGLPYNQAWEMARQEFLFLPPESPR